jgi:ubiquinone/menaquinone biosynthesis C-methylase UbiE
MSTLNGTKYWDQYAADFALHYNEELAKFIKDLTLSLRASSVLEVGCSAGNDLRLFPKDFDVNGVDQSEFAIKTASQNLPFFKFRIASALSLPYDNAAVDLVFTRNLLNYVENSDVEKIIKELFRVSKKYILNVELSSDKEQQIENAVPAWGRDMQKYWMNFNVKIISNVEMHQDIDPERSRFTLIRKI